MTVGDDVLKFGYDASGSPMYLQFNNSRYFYATNVQGDVTALVHTSGTAVVEYTYDAWGNILTITGSMADTVGQINPLRYRGYVYDTETKIYYLQSRYYDPTTGRFLNADALVSTGQGILGNNMFAYCRNNPVCRKDVAGTEDVIAFSDGELLSNDDLDDRAKGGGSKITLFRAVSQSEGRSVINTQKFSAGNNSYESGKFFATSQQDAQSWGDLMYKDGSYSVISATLDSGVVYAPGVICYSRLDGIGSAYLIPISAVNDSVISICYV